MKAKELRKLINVRERSALDYQPSLVYLKQQQPDLDERIRVLAQHPGRHLPTTSKLIGVLLFVTVVTITRDIPHYCISDTLSHNTSK
jgi:hypothetical protein